MAREIALRHLTVRARSRAELEGNLAKRGVEEHVAAKVLDRLTEVGLINDADFATAWVTSRHASRQASSRLLRQELRGKGVADDEIVAALEQVTPDDELEAARTLVSRKRRSMAGLEPTVAYRRLAGMLARRGFGAGLIHSVLGEHEAG